MRARTGFRFLCVVLPTVGLMILWLSCLPRQGQAAASGPEGPAGDASQEWQNRAMEDGEQNNHPPQPAPTSEATPDPRWLELVRGRSKGAAPDAQAMTMNINLTDGFIAGRAPTAAEVALSVWDQEELIISLNVTPMFDGSGFFYLGFPYGLYLQAGYVAWATQGSASISMTLPAMTALAYPQTDILSGTAPADAALTGYLFPYADPGQVYTATTTATAVGAYQMDWSPGTDLQAHDDGYVIFTQDATHMASVRFAAPFLQVQVNGPEITGVAAPLQMVTIEIKDAGGSLLAVFASYSNANGDFYKGYCALGGGQCVEYASATDMVIVSAGGQTFSMTLSNLTADADQQSGLVSGQAPPDQPVAVLRYQGPLSGWDYYPLGANPLEQVVVTATADGSYAAPILLEAGNFGATRITTQEGYQEYARYVVPYLYVSLGGPPEYAYGWVRMWGQVSQPDTVITVEVQGPSGYLKDWYLLASWENGYFEDRMYSGWSDLILESGDRITLTILQYPPIALLLPELTAEADPNTNIVSGQAPPLSQVVVTVDFVNALTVTADAAGQYMADFSSQGGFDKYPQGRVVWQSPEGYAVERRFYTLPEAQCPTTLSLAQIAGNEIYFNGSNTCGPMKLLLRGSNGQIKYEHLFEWAIPYTALYDENLQPILISSGDQIEITSSGQTNIFVVPKLTATLTAETDRVQGQAPPSASLELYWDNHEILTTTADIQGHYSVDLTGQVDLQAGDFVEVVLAGSARFYTIGVLPVMTAYLYDTKVTGRLAPYTPYSITLVTPLTTTEPYVGLSSHEGEFTSGFYPPPNSRPIALPGDRLEMETPTHFYELILPFLTAQLDVTTHIVQGQAPPNSLLSVNLLESGDISFSTWVTATTDGTYAAVLPLSTNPGFVSGFISYISSEDTRTNLGFHTPYWRVTLGDNMVSGSGPMDGAPITVTLESTSGFRQVVTDFGHRYGGDFMAIFTRPVNPGDTLRLETAGGVVSEFDVPVLSATYDYKRHVLEGRGPVGVALFASIHNGFYDVIRHIRQSADGRFGVDASDLNPFVGDYGFVQYTDRWGNVVTRWYTVRGYPQFLPILSQGATFP